MDCGTLVPSLARGATFRATPAIIPRHRARHTGHHCPVTVRPIAPARMAAPRVSEGTTSPLILGGRVGRTREENIQEHAERVTDEQPTQTKSDQRDRCGNPELVA
jgi:hypothetical protein